ncbi:hypothetical protein EZS27_020658 [termite gut metagenome]|uniref:Uncharacterized protein n=1 Tax=termite gut metagenome TaxID=433724 RepID=A0A5J4RAS2_9ZZZZ
MNEARHNLREIKEYIGKDNIRRANEVIKDLYEQTHDLEQYPHMGRMVPEYGDSHVRELIRGNYRIIYKVVDDDTIHILAVCHSSRLLGNVVPMDT